MDTQKLLPFIALFFGLLLFSFYDSNGQKIQEIPGELPGLNTGGADFADFDRDGDIDILLTGKTDQDEPLTRIYRNDGEYGFSAQQAGLTNVWLGDAAWGDYNTDGYPDVLISGATQSGSPYSPVTKIYKNNGNGTFSEVSTSSLKGYYGSSVDWGDFDSNGVPDILITGKNANGEVATHVYNNAGGNRFMEVTNNELPGVWLGDGKFGDFNNDNDLDILITGQNAKGRPFSAIIANGGNLDFTVKTDVSLVGLSYSTADWKDYDRDGNPDIMLTGKNVGNVPTTKFYKNNGDGSFSEASDIRFTGVMAGSVAWGHYDKNGYEDILLTGRNSAGQAIAKIYKNFGGGSFGVVKDIGLTGVSYSSIGWHSGEEQKFILISGQTSSGSSITKLYKMETKKKVTFKVKNSETNKPINRADVSINDEKLKTSAMGQSEIKLGKGEYNYAINADGYVSKRGNLTIKNKNITKTISLKPVKKLVLTLKNADTNSPIPNARVKIGESTITTGQNGIARLDTFTGNYNCVVQASGFTTTSTQVSLEGEDMRKTLKLKPVYSIELSLKNADTKKPVKGARVQIGKATVKSNSKGIASLDTIKGSYRYSVQAKGYVNKQGTVNLKASDAVKFVKLTPTYQLKLRFYNSDTQEPLTRMPVGIGGKNKLTNEQGVIKLDTLKGKYSVTLKAFGYVAKYDTIRISNKDVEKEYSVMPTYKAVFYIQEGKNGGPVEGATIEIGNKTLKTNAAGMAVMDTTNGSYRYTIKIRGETYATKKFTIDGSSIRLKFIAN